MTVKLVAVTKNLSNRLDNPIETMENAACNCYDSQPTKDGRISTSCIQSGHSSIAEFLNFTFHIEGVSRSLLAQLTRHRMASFEVQSQRYVNMIDFKPICPRSIKNNPEIYGLWCSLMESINDFYSTAIAKGIEKEDARYALPNACPTTLEVKMNFRGLINFIVMARTLVTLVMG